MGHSLTLLTAVLFVGQTPVIDSNGKSCNCNKRTQGRVLAQPEMMTETRTVAWWNGRSSATTSTETWSSGTQPTSWVDNRPVLSKIKGWFSKSDNGTTTRTESVPTTTSQPLIVQPMPTTTNEFNYRRLPTTNEPPLNTAPAKPAVQPKPAAPATPPSPPSKGGAGGVPAQITLPPAAPLTIEVEPIEFRPAGSAKGAAPAVVAPASAPIASFGKPSTSTRPNPISPRFTDKVGQPGDYSWITGQLEIRGGAYLLHYATPETIDQHHGSLVLSADGKLLNNVRSGDLVSVHGSVVQQSGRAVYRVQAIDLIER